MDDFVPTLDSDETPCFARPTNGQSELWVPLLEKALAKVLAVAHTANLDDKFIYERDRVLPFTRGESYIPCVS